MFTIIILIAIYSRIYNRKKENKTEKIFQRDISTMIEKLTAESLEADDFFVEINRTRRSFFWDNALPVLFLQETWKSLRILTRSFNFLFCSIFASIWTNLLRRNLWQDLFFLIASINIFADFGKLEQLDGNADELRGSDWCHSMAAEGCISKFSPNLWDVGQSYSESGNLLQTSIPSTNKLLEVSFLKDMPEAWTCSSFFEEFSFPLFKVSRIIHYKILEKSIQGNCINIKHIDLIMTAIKWEKSMMNQSARNMFMHKEHIFFIHSCLFVPACASSADKCMEN